MKCFKGFDKNLSCRGYQYEVGKEYETESAELCKNGFHACEIPHDVFRYYPPGESRYCKVDLDATNETNEDDSKRVGRKILIQKEISAADIAKMSAPAFFENFGFDEKIKRAKESGAANAGDCGAANAGDCGAANAGDRGAANAGDRGAAIVRREGKASVGKGGAAIGLGNGAQAKGETGALLVLTLYDDDGNIICAKAAVVDGEMIKADTYYTIENGELKEAQ